MAKSGYWADRVEKMRARERAIIAAGKTEPNAQPPRARKPAEAPIRVTAPPIRIWPCGTSRETAAHVRQLARERHDEPGRESRQPRTIKVTGYAEATLPPGHVLTVWAVYDRPRDFPGRVVLRPHFVVSGELEPVASREQWLRDSLDDIHAILPPGLARIAPSEGDDPAITEVWV